MKDVVFEHMVEVITIVSGNGADDFNARQLLYRLRPIVKEANGQTLTTKNFNKILTAYENEHSEIEGMYRDPRGSISHPHTGNVIPLSTRSVENYVRPFWEFNKIIFIEKEGFSDAARRRGWDKRHDCMVMSSKGFYSRGQRLHRQACRA
jgi:DNA topoisomerase VI subunit A